MFRRFVHIFARIEGSLNNKMENDQPKHFVEFTDKELCAGHELQRKLSLPPIVAQLNDNEN